MTLEIQPQYADTVVGFNNSGKPLGQRSQKDLLDLAEMAYLNPQFKEYFVSLPALADIRDAKAGKVVAATTAQSGSDGAGARAEPAQPAAAAEGAAATAPEPAPEEPQPAQAVGDGESHQ